MPDRDAHWEHIYATRAATSLSWYEDEPLTSLRLIEAVVPGTAAAVVDVGGGTSSLVDCLLDRGFTDVTVLDISGHAIEETGRRLGEKASRVCLLTLDVLAWKPDRRYGVWHDRAVFHFLTEESARREYVSVAGGAVSGTGALVLGSFAEDGPSECSGLPVERYSAERLAGFFRPSFALVGHERQEHPTPLGALQPFTWVVLRRSPPPRAAVETQ